MATTSRKAETLNEQFFQSYRIIKEKRSLKKGRKCFVANAGYCLSISGVLPGSIHSGYRGLATELLKNFLIGSAKKGVKWDGLNKSALLFHNSWSSGYYHWLIEAIPRLFSLRQYWGSIPLIIPEKIPNQWFRPWLKEISKMNYYELLSGSCFFDTVYFQKNPPQMTMHYPQELLDVASYFRHLAQAGEISSLEKRFIYISRKNAQHRKVTNEDEVEHLLSKYGFKCYELDEIDFLGQVTIFAQAEVVVSIHGAGLSNILFMKKGSHVLEFFQQPDPLMTWGSRRKTHLLNPCYKALAEALCLNYNFLLCSYDPSHTSAKIIRKHGTLHGNIFVDINSLDKKLRSILRYV